MLIEIGSTMKNKGIFKYVLVFVCFVIFIEKSYAQFQDMKFEYLNIDNGLSHNRIRSILRDSKGYLWVGTESGLNKYDGQKVTIYKNSPIQTNSISNNTSDCIFEDRSHNLWVGTIAGLNLYDRKKNTFKQYILDINSKSGDQNLINHDNWINSIFEDIKGNIWCSTLNGLNKLNPSDGSFVKYNIPAAENYEFANYVISIVPDDKGYFWLGTQDNKLWRFNPETFKFDSYAEPILTPTIGMDKHIVLDASGKIWIGTDGKGLFSYDLSGKKFEQYNTRGDGRGTRGNLVKGLFLDRNRYLFIAVDLGGINRLDLQTKTFEYCLRNEKEKNALNSDALWRVYKDSEGILYAGTSVAGLNIYKPPKDKFPNYRHIANYDNSLVYDVVYKFFEDSQGLIWIGTDGGGVSVFDPVKKTFRNYRHNREDPFSLSGNAVLSITEDKNHDIWLGTWEAGLNRFDRKTGKFYHFMPNPAHSDAISNPYVMDLFTDNKGKIWIAYNRYILDVFDIKKGVIRKYRENTSDSALFCSFMTNRFIRQSDGKMGFATNKGYYVLDSITNRIQQVNFFKDYDLTDVYLDRKGNYWAGTTNRGIILVKPDGVIEKFDESNGFPSNSISGFLEDNLGNIWVLTSSGLAEYRFELNQFRHFNYSNGLQGRQFTTFARLKAKDGTLYIGGFNGFNVFRPEEIKETSYTPSVYIDEFRIFNEPVPIDSLNSPLKQSIEETKKITLNYKQSVFSFGFTAVNFTHPEYALYAYKMDGYDEKWNYTNASRRYVSYTNLNPGKYTFMVKATNSDGVWNETPTTIIITITPPFWKTWWFKILSVLLIAGSIISFYRIRINQLKHQKRLLERKVKERTSELQEANITLEEHQGEILKQNQEIIHITNLLHESDQIKIKFFTNISHDLRTPLTLILGYLESIIPGIANNKTLSERLAIVTNNANRLLRLVTQLLDFQKIDAESLKLQTEYQDIIIFTRNIFDSFKLQAEKNQIEYCMTSERETYSTWFDPDKLDKILFNLLSNAFKFTPDSGKIKLELDFSCINQSVKASPDTLIIRVIDSGVGIQEKDLKKIFDRFYQADNSFSDKYKGSGIGLALTKHLVELHHGTITVKSKPGEGSCFEVKLIVGNSLEAYPVKPEDPSILPFSESIQFVKSEIKEENEPVKLEGSTILIVEDNEELRHFICSELGGKYQILEANNGKQGLEIAIRKQPDLVISDVMMPIMDGFEMCEKLKLEWQTSHIPIIILTAKADEESFYQSLEIGADAYIRKPFHLKHLFFQVENLLTNRRKLFDKLSKNPIIGLEIQSTNSADNEFLMKLYQIIEDHIDDSNFGVEGLAYEVNLSRSQLYRKTFPILKISIGELIRTMRLKKAAVFLRDQNNSVSEVAQMVGFADRPQFSRSFTNLFGISPKQFQIQGNDVQLENMEE